MKILYLTDQTFLHGGVEKVLSQKANYLAEVMNDEVVIVTNRQQNHKRIYPFSNKIKFVDIGVNYDIAKSYFNPDNLRKIPHHRSALKKVIQQLKPDLIISSSFEPDFYFLPFLEKQIPKIKEFHGSRYFYVEQEKTLIKKFLHQLNKITEQKYHQIVVLNASEIPFYNNSKISVIPNPAELSGERASHSSKKIMAAGRISPVKNFGDLIKVFSRIRKEFPDWEVHFFGEDYLGTQQILEQQISEVGLEDQIKFKGVAADLKKEMQKYSIYSMTSETECFPMVLLESLSVGLPVVSYECPTGPKHILKNEEDSFLVPYKNLDIFTEKLKLLMSDEDLQKEMGTKGIDNVQRFRIDKIMLQWKELFTSLL